MEPTLAVIGLNHRTSPVAVRERFWMSEARRYEALHRLVRAEGVDEVIVFATCNRTEFLLWTNDAPTAANSVLRFLAHDYQLKLDDWSHFYRLMDDSAVTHVFRVVSGLDSLILGDPGMVEHAEEAWRQSQEAGTTGRFLDAVLQKATFVSQRVRTETSLAASPESLPSAAVELARETLGELSGRELLLIGAGRMGELAAQHFARAGVKRFKVMNRTLAHGEELAHKLGAKAVTCEDRSRQLEHTDIVVSSTSCPQCVISRHDAERTAAARHYKPLVIIDMAVPRDIDPAVRGVEGLFLFDLDDLERIGKRKTGGQQAVLAEAERIVQEEAQGFRRKLMAERVVPTIAALRARLEELCRQELQTVREERGPFTGDQDEVLNTLVGHISQRLAGSLARELRELPERTQQDMLAAAIKRLFHIEQADMPAAGQQN